MPLAQTWEYVCFLGKPSWHWHCGGFYVKRWDNNHAAVPAQAPAVQQMVYTGPSSGGTCAASGPGATPSDTLRQRAATSGPE